MNGESAGASHGVRAAFEDAAPGSARERGGDFPVRGPAVGVGITVVVGARACVVAALARGGSVSRGMAGAYSAAVGGPSAGLVPSSRARWSSATLVLARRIMGNFGSVSTARARASLASVVGNRSGAGHGGRLFGGRGRPERGLDLFVSGEPSATGAKCTTALSPPGADCRPGRLA